LTVKPPPTARPSQTSLLSVVPEPASQPSLSEPLESGLEAVDYSERVGGVDCPTYLATSNSMSSRSPSRECIIFPKHRIEYHLAMSDKKLEDAGPPGEAAAEILDGRIWIDGCFDFFHQ